MNTVLLWRVLLWVPSGFKWSSYACYREHSVHAPRQREATLHWRIWVRLTGTKAQQNIPTDEPCASYLGYALIINNKNKIYISVLLNGNKPVVIWKKSGAQRNDLLRLKTGLKLNRFHVVGHMYHVPYTLMPKPNSRRFAEDIRV